MFVSDTYNNIGLSKVLFLPLVQTQACKAALPHDESEAQSPSIFSLHLYIPEMLPFFHKAQNGFTSCSHSS